MNILGVRVDNFSREDVFQKIRHFLDDPRFHQIATVNPEFILEAEKNESFRKILNGCDLNLPDGFGLNLAFWKRGERLKFRLAGADLVSEILNLAEEKNLSVFLACRRDGLSSLEETCEAILKIHPRLKVSGANLDKNAAGSQLSAGPGVLLCNFGAPFQEVFIKNQKNATIRLAVGVGGSFDYLTGKIQRAPSWMRKAGLEWLFRFVRQPGRWKRIFRAVIVFPVKLIFNYKKHD